jgi:hypothetical protein
MISEYGEMLIRERDTPSEPQCAGLRGRFGAVSNCGRVGI